MLFFDLKMNITKNLNWKSIEEYFKPDGALRDIYIYDANIELWNFFLNFVTSNFSFIFQYQDVERKTLLSYEEIKKFQNDNPIVLKILLDKISINCHFFCEDEIELDIDPKEIDENNYNSLILFIENIGFNLNRNVIITDENSKESIFLTYKFLERIFILP